MHCVIPPRSALPALALALGLCAGACGGAEVPTHDGYNTARPWAKAKPLELDSTGETDVDGAISYPKKVRARWYQVELPEPGEIAAKLELVTLGTDELPALDFEVLDSGYNVLMSTRPEGEEAVDAQPEKQLSLMELSPGTYYLHVYTMERTAKARFNLRVTFTPGALDEASSFPEQVAYVPPLPIVPAFDDAPPPEPKRRYRGRRPPRKEPDEKPAAEARTVRILGAMASGNGTRITLSVGSSDGVDAGWKGNVVTTSGAVVGNGGFTIDAVTANRSKATVSLPRDQVLAAKRARIGPP